MFLSFRDILSQIKFKSDAKHGQKVIELESR